MKHKQHEKAKKAICGPTQGNWQQMNRKQRREMTRKIQSEDISLELSIRLALIFIKAILAGERDPHKLAEFRDPRVKAREQEIARSLEGNWQVDLLFVAAGTGWLRVLPDGRVRSAARTVSRAEGRPQRRGSSARREAQGPAQEEEWQ